MIPHVICFVKLYLQRSTAISLFPQFDEVSGNFESRKHPICRNYVHDVFMTVGPASN